MPDEVSKKNNIFLLIIFISCAAIIAFAFYNFYINKNYQFFVETKCDNSKDTCFYRDCSIEGECPPDNLSYFKKFTISASDANFCSSEDCTAPCESKTIQCEETICTNSDIESGICVLPESTLKNLSDAAID